MKIILIVSFVFSCGIFHAQKIDSTRVCKYSLKEFETELSENRIYTVSEAESLGRQKASCDLQENKKSIIIWTGMFFDSHCENCFYSAHGFSVESFLYSDFLYPNDFTSSFVSAYNRQMNSLLSENEKEELFTITKNNHDDYSSDPLHKFSADISQLNDSNLIIKLSNAELEQQFGQEISKLKISIVVKELNFSTDVFYNDIKTKGVEIPITDLTTLKLRISVKLGMVENGWKTCWCSALEPFYSVILPVRITRN